MTGWGAHAFYTTTGSYSDISASAVLRGIFGDSAVMRVDVLPALAEAGPWTTLHLSRPEYEALLSAITKSFALTPDGTAQMLDHPGFTSTDRFFEAQGHFNILNTCNVWVGEMLRTAGQDFGAWTPAPFSISLSLGAHAD